MNLHWLGSLITQARRDAFPLADLRFVSSEVMNLHEELTKRTLHAAFFSGRLGQSDTSELRSLPLFREAFMAVLGLRHRLAHSTPLRIDQLQHESVVWLSRDVDPVLYDSFMALCSSQGYRPKIVQEVRTFYECLQFTREGLGITFLPPFMQSGDRDDRVVFVSLTEGTLDVEYTLAYRRNGSSEGVDRFIQFVREHVPGQTLRGLHATRHDRSLPSIVPQKTND